MKVFYIPKRFCNLEFIISNGMSWFHEYTSLLLQMLIKTKVRRFNCNCSGLETCEIMILFLAIPHNMVWLARILVCLKFRFVIHCFLQHCYFLGRDLGVNTLNFVFLSSCEMEMLFLKAGDSNILNFHRLIVYSIIWTSKPLHHCTKMWCWWNVTDLYPSLCHRPVWALSLY